MPKNSVSACLTGINEANPLFMDIALSEAVLVTGCARLQQNPKNASHKSLAWAGRLYGIKGLYSKILLKPRPSVYAASSVLKTGRKGVVPETGLDTLQPLVFKG